MSEEEFVPGKKLPWIMDAISKELESKPDMGQQTTLTGDHGNKS